MNPSYFEAWRVDEPPADFAERVAATAFGGAKRRITRRAAVGVAAAACTALAAWRVGRALSPGVGDLTAKVRTEVELAPGAIAILEQGARLLWDREGVRQMSGDVSYRLLPESILQITTPLASVRALGSSCRIKLAEAAGRMTALFVSVSGGNVDVVSLSRRAALHGGQYARVTSLAIDTEADDVSGDIARELDLKPPPRAAAPLPPDHEEPAASPPLAKRPPERAPRPAPSLGAPASAPAAVSADAGARTVIVPSCFCDRGDSLCACFH